MFSKNYFLYAICFLDTSSYCDQNTVVCDDDVEYEIVKIDEEDLEACYEVVYKDLEDSEGYMVQMVTETSVRATSMIGSRQFQPSQEDKEDLFSVGIELDTLAKVDAAVATQS